MLFHPFIVDPLSRQPRVAGQICQIVVFVVARVRSTVTDGKRAANSAAQR
jgi:hypothetical protein